MKFILTLLTYIFFCNSSIAATLHGQLLPNTVITIYKYSDYVVYNKIPIAETITDAAGKFSINISLGKLDRLSINIGDDILRLYASDNINYTLSQKNNKYSISTDDDKENINDKLKHGLADWNTVHDVWVKNRRFVAIDNPERILHKLDTIKTSIMTDRYKDAYEYDLANKAMFYIVNSYVKSDLIVAYQLFDTLIEDMIINKPVAVDDPFYMSFIESYVRTRMNATKFLRVRGKESVYNRVVGEASSFNNDSLKELILVQGINKLYQYKWYDGATIDTLNARANSLKQTMTIPLFKEYMGSVIRHYNEVAIGDSFPILSLKDHKGNDYSIDKVKAPYILVYFWATWCVPCKRSMTKFPELKAKYKDSLEIVSISADAEWQDMVDFLNTKNYTGKWIALHNGDRGDYHDVVPISVYPTYYILDKDKKVVAIPKFNKVFDVLEQLMKQ